MVTRRSFAFGGLALPLLAEGPLARGPDPSPAARPLIVVLSGIEAGTPFPRLSAFCEPFLKQGICVTLGLSFKTGDGTGFGALARELRRLADTYPKLVEIAIDAGDIASANPYWQLRQASALQAQFTKALNPVGDIFVEPLLMAMTLLTASPAHGLDDLGNMRAAGIRTVIHLKPQFADERNLDPGYWLAGTGLRHAFVSATAPVAGVLPLPELDAAIDGFIASSGPAIYNIPLSSAGTLSDTDVPAHARKLASQLSAGIKARYLRTELPHTLHVQSRTGPHRYIIVRIDDYRLNPNDGRAHIEFTDRLRELGIPMTEAVIPGGAIAIGDDDAARTRLAFLKTNATYEPALHGLNHAPREMAGNSVAGNAALVRKGLRAIHGTIDSVPVSFIPPNNAFDDNSLTALSRCGLSNFSADQGNYDWIWGLDRHGLLHASNIVYPEKDWSDGVPLFEPDEILGQLGDKNDAVFMIHPATLSTPQKRQNCFDLLEILRTQPGTELTTLDLYARKVTQPMPMLQAVRAARTMVEVIDSREAAFVAPSRANLLEDAAAAWQYFDAWNKKFDTLVPATGWRNGKSLEAYPFLTMWDVASLIMAHVSAHRIGLIGDARFDSAMAKIVTFLAGATFRFKTSRLPAAEVPIGRVRGQRKGFDATDTGRLLIALKALDNYTDQGLGVSKLVASWNLHAAVADGELYNISKGRLDSSQANSYAHYAALGYRLWGVEVRPVYREMHALADMDATLRFLDEVRARGRVATEPNVTELIETGESEPSRVIGDMLLAAQIDRYDLTGIPTCVSEGPVDDRPWFIYQAYQIKENGTGEWPVDGPPGGKKYLTAKAVEEMRAISTKGCFLWMAARPGVYSSMLYNLARESAKIDGLGFASGILERTMKRTNHSDINTNGIILEALAFMLTGRKPLLDLDRGTGQTIGPLTQLQ